MDKRHRIKEYLEVRSVDESLDMIANASRMRWYDHLLRRKKINL